MSRPTPLSAAFASSRAGRAALHFGCLVRGGRRRWHLRGIIRELFGIRFKGSDRASFKKVGEPPKVFRSEAPSGRESCSVPHRILGALLSCALVGGAFPVLAFPEPTAFDLSSAAAVDGTGVYLHQILSKT